MRKVLAMVAVAGLLAGLAAWAQDAPKKEEAKKPASDYVGAKKCMPCHAKIYKSWAETKHAKAFESLKNTTPEQLKAMNELLKTDVQASPAANNDCVKCHVTGFGVQPSGYPNADSTRNAVLAMVGCESCHGPGGAHMAVKMADKEGRRATVLKPTAETCEGCHPKAVFPKFDFAERSKKVHPVAAAAAPAK